MVRAKKEVLSAKVYYLLREMVANYRFQPGCHMNVEKLARELKVSRAPVWEAIRRLQQEGLVQDIPNRGVFMMEMSLAKAFELFEVRQALEGLAGRLAARHMDQRTLRKMAQCLEEQSQVIAKGDLVGYSRLDYQFHALVYRKSKNSFLCETLDSIKLRMQPVNFRIMPLLIPLYQDHSEILKALQDQDPSRAEKAFHKHNRRVLVQIKAEAGREAALIRHSRQMKSH